MANPYGYGPPPPVPAGNDRTQLWGILALIFGAIPCCWLLGIIFAVLQIVEARKWNKKPTLAYVALGLVAFWFVVWLILTVTGNMHYSFNTNSY
jgi:hypothetical protein